MAGPAHWGLVLDEAAEPKVLLPQLLLQFVIALIEVLNLLGLDARNLI